MVYRAKCRGYDGWFSVVFYSIQADRFCMGDGLLVPMFVLDGNSKLVQAHKFSVGTCRMEALQRIEQLCRRIPEGSVDVRWTRLESIGTCAIR